MSKKTAPGSVLVSVRMKPWQKRRLDGIAAQRGDGVGASGLLADVVRAVCGEDSADAE